MKNYVLAIDIGASSGRHILARFEDGELRLKEIYRFRNGAVAKNGSMVWDLEALFASVVEGLKECARLNIVPQSVGIDTWGVDFALLDREGGLIGESYCYRDKSTEGYPLKSEEVLSLEEQYAINGIYPNQFNTLYQLAARYNLRNNYEYLLFLPDYLNYRLTGVKKTEYTNATTSGLLNIEGDWDEGLISAFGLPRKIFGRISRPKTSVGAFKEEIVKETGFNTEVVMPCSHDTASAFYSEKDNKGILISSGTWSLMGVIRDSADTSRAALKDGFTNEGGYKGFRFLKNIMGLWMIQRLKEETGADFSELERLARGSGYRKTVDVNDESFLAPPSMTEAVRLRCVKEGGSEPEGIADIASCVYHSLAESYAKTALALEAHTGKIYETITVMGGGSRDGYLNELTGLYTGKRVVIGRTEATAAGNALLQLELAEERNS